MKKILFLLVFVLVSFAVSAEETQKEEVFYFFYSDSCPHCHEAMPFIEELEKERPDITFKKLEVSKDEVNQALFNKKVGKLEIKNVGVPLFIFNGKFVVGFKKGSFEEKIRAIIGKPAEKIVPGKDAKPAEQIAPAKDTESEKQGKSKTAK